MPARPTRGWLIRVMREVKSTPADTVIPFGKFKGWLYHEVPIKYLKWAVEECQTNDNAHPDLRCLAAWAEEELKLLNVKVKTDLTTDPEATARVPPPTTTELRESTASDSSWPRVGGSSPGPQLKRTPTRPRRVGVMQGEDVEGSEEEEILRLEARLAMLRDRRSPDVHMTRPEATE